MKIKVHTFCGPEESMKAKFDRNYELRTCINFLSWQSTTAAKKEDIVITEDFSFLAKLSNGKNPHWAIQVEDQFFFSFESLYAFWQEKSLMLC